MTTHVSQIYFLGPIMMGVVFRFFFALKATRAYGPFTKVIKITLAVIFPWILGAMLLLFLTGYVLFTLMSEEIHACHSSYSCFLAVGEASIGNVFFRKVARTFTGSLTLAGGSIVLGVVVINMCIAKVTSIYQFVSTRGTLYYYKDLIDLRYLYKTDSKYGFLVALEHPFSLFFLPFIYIIRRLRKFKNYKLHNNKSIK